MISDLHYIPVENANEDLHRSQTPSAGGNAEREACCHEGWLPTRDRHFGTPKESTV